MPDHIVIGFACPPKEPLHWIWTILHEFGHHLSGKPTREEAVSVPRERLAWVKAEEELQRYPDLLAHRADFYALRDHLIKDYIEQLGHNEPS